MNAINTTNSERGQIDLRAMIAIGVVVIVVAVGIWLLFQEQAPEPVPAPSPERPIETVEPAESPAERGDSAREVIEELESNAEGVDYAVAYERGREFLAEGRGGHGGLFRIDPVGAVRACATSA